MKALFLLLTLMVIPTDGVVPNDPPTGDDVRSISALRVNLAKELPTTFRADCGSCKWCLGGHKVTDWTPFPEYQTHECWGGVCGAHPGCEGFAAADMEALWETVRSGTVEDLKHFLADNRETLHFNTDRSALQVFACGGLQSHVPLSPMQVEAMKPE